jgi:hypothetical protein
MPNVQAPDGSVIEFPESMPMDQISAVMRSKYPPAPAPDTRNSLQRGVDGMIDYVEHPEQRGEHAPASLTKFAGGVLRGSLGVIAHPIDAVQGALQSMDMSPQAAQRAAANDPGIAATIGGIVGGAALGEAARPILAPAMSATMRGARRAVLLGKTPEAAYEGALKPSTTLPQADRSAIVKTGLQNEIPVSKAGLEKLGDRIETLNQAIKDEIGADPTRPIDPNTVATRSADARAKFAKQVNAQPDLNAIEASRQQFLDEQGAKPGTPATPTGLVDAQGKPIMRPAQPPTPAPPMNALDAQEMKQGTYRVLKGKFGEQGSASVEAQKSLARGLKEEIATQFPEISKLNATESQLLDLQPILERAVNRISNHQIIGIGTPVAGAAAKAVTGSGAAGAVASVLKAVLDNPSVKSRLAIAVSKGAKIPYSQAAARVGAYSTSLAAIAGGSQGYSSADNPNPPATPQP